MNAAVMKPSAGSDAAGGVAISEANDVEHITPSLIGCVISLQQNSATARGNDEAEGNSRDPARSGRRNACCGWSCGCISAFIEADGVVACRDVGGNVSGTEFLHNRIDPSVLQVTIR